MLNVPASETFFALSPGSSLSPYKPPLPAPAFSRFLLLLFSCVGAPKTLLYQLASFLVLIALCRFPSFSLSAASSFAMTFDLAKVLESLGLVSLWD